MADRAGRLKLRGGRETAQNPKIHSPGDHLVLVVGPLLLGLQQDRDSKKFRLAALIFKSTLCFP
jgi:hypothetical protein